MFGHKTITQKIAERLHLTRKKKQHGLLHWLHVAAAYVLLFVLGFTLGTLF